jgi:hypothetical protein
MKLWLGSIAVSIATSLSLSLPANAVSFNFSFTNSTYPETVTGVITGLVLLNTFEVTGGVITGFSFESFGNLNTSPM